MASTSKVIPLSDTVLPTLDSCFIHVWAAARCQRASVGSRQLVTRGFVKEVKDIFCNRDAQGRMAARGAECEERVRYFPGRGWKTVNKHWCRRWNINAKMSGESINEPIGFL